MDNQAQLNASTREEFRRVLGSLFNTIRDLCHMEKDAAGKWVNVLAERDWAVCVEYVDALKAWAEGKESNVRVGYNGTGYSTDPVVAYFFDSEEEALRYGNPYLIDANNRPIYFHAERADVWLKRQLERRLETAIELNKRLVETEESKNN